MGYSHIHMHYFLFAVERQILEGSNKRMEGRVKYLHMQISEER